MLSGALYLLKQNNDLKGLKYILSTYVLIMAFFPIINIIIPLFFLLASRIDD